MSGVIFIEPQKAQKTRKVLLNSFSVMSVFSVVNGILKTLNNPDLKPIELEGFRKQVGLITFALKNESGCNGAY